MAKRRVRVDRYNVPETSEQADSVSAGASDSLPAAEDALVDGSTGQSSQALEATEQEEEFPESCGCPVLDHADWHRVESDWSDISFLRLHAGAVFGVIANYQKLLDRVLAEAESVGLKPPDEPMVLLGPGKFRRPVLVEVEDTEETSVSLVRPGGFAYTQIVSAPPGQITDILAEAANTAGDKYGREPSAMWTWYLTCRKCSADREFETLFVAHFDTES